MMKRGATQTLVRDLDTLYRMGTVSGLTDRELLGHFTMGDGAAAQQAFEAIVHRHGPMVLGVCRRVLRDPHAAEDAFQATFLVLAIRADSIRKRDSLGCWLHGVAARISRRARLLSRRRDVPQLVPLSPASRDAEGSGIEVAELRSVLDEEVDRLPAAYRRAVVLCYVEGKTQEDAARELGWTKGTLSGRLARAKEMLRVRLTRRGFAPPAGLLGLILAEESVSAAVVEGAVRIAVGAALGRGEVLAASSTVMCLTRGALRAMLLAKVKLAPVALMVLAAFAATSALTSTSPAGPGQDPPRITRDILAAQPGAAETPKPGRILKLEVVSGAENASVAGAVAWVEAEASRPRISQGRTDEEGRYTIAVPGGANSSLRVVIVHPGLAPIELRWDGQQPIPESYTVALDRGLPIGGTVRDEQGRPIAGARVHLQVGAIPPRGGPDRYPGPGSELADAITDAEGRWRSEALPASAGPGVRLELVTTHPDHVGLKQPVTPESLRTFAAIGVMKTGRSLSGTVLSPVGRPVAGATITVQSMSDRTMPRRIPTDREGRFQTGPFIDPSWSEFTMVVEAEGFASSSQLLLVPQEIAAQSIRLSPRRPLHGRVVDAQGRPIPGAVVRSATEFGFAGLDWSVETDSDGRFTWYEAPASGSYMLDVAKPNFRQIVARMIPGGADGITLTLHCPRRLHGTVTDAETGRPIERFDLISVQGPIRPGWSPQWSQGSSRSFGGGRFDLIDSGIEQELNRSIRVESEGYEPAEFLGFSDSLEDVAHDFRLRKATRLEGIVRGPDGRPMAGVSVALAGEGYGARIENGQLKPGSVDDRILRMQTGPDGRYAFSHPGRLGSVIAIHDSGFAIRSAEELAASADLTLAPWARLEGLLKVGAGPAPGQRMVARLLESGWASVDNNVRTDESGRFVMDRVAPGRLTVYHRVETPGRTVWMASHAVNLDVKPGETVRLQIGGTGRPVVGRLAIPDGVKLDQLAVGYGQNALVPVLREPPTPDDYLVFDSARRSAWWDAFSRTPEGRAYAEDRDRSYAVDLRPDGTFRVEDVPAGRYVLKLPFEGLSRGTREGRQAFARSEVVVPDMPGGRSDEALDIGAIPLEVFPFHEPRVGDLAPTIAARTLDLVALRGKCVLLHFWSGRPEDAATIPYLKATYEAFGRDPRFVMIGLNADETPGPVRRYAARHGLGWEQRYIGSTYDPNPIEAAFGVWFPPAAFLIGPDGRFLAKDLEGKAIQRAVAECLSKGP